MTRGMNAIETLLAKHCPDGVEWRALNALCDLITTGRLNANAMEDDGIYPFFTCNEKSYKINNYAFDLEAILISGNGNGHINYYRGKFNAYQRTYVVGNFKDNVQVMYLFHYFNHALKSYITRNSRKGTVPYITMPMLQSFPVPIPPLAVQEYIVGVLDTFTELEAELEARVAQYKYYREKMLTFGDDVEYRALGEVCLETANIKWKENISKEYHYIDLSSVNRENNKITETYKININNAPSRAKQIVFEDDVIFGTTRPTLKRFCVIPKEYDGQVCSTGFCILRADTTKILPKYLYFSITTSTFNAYVECNQEGASYPSISNTKVKKLTIPIPPLAEQERIVSLLDKFDALVNDISIGLPAELKARRAQYEYYREYLLSFGATQNTM